MKISPAGKVLGPQEDKYTVLRDGLSLPMIGTPGGRILRLQQLQHGHWEAPAMEPADTAFFVEAANMLRDKNRADQKVIDDQANLEEEERHREPR